MADFGENRLWPNRLWPKPTLAKTEFGQIEFGQIEFDLLCVVCCVFVCLCVCVCAVWRGFSVGVGFKVLVWSCSVPLGPSPGPPFPEPPFPWTAQNFALFSPSRPIFALFVSLGVFSLNFGGFCEDRGPQMCTFGLSGCRVEPRRLLGLPGLHTTTRELQTCTLEPPGASNTTKIPREDPRREEKRTNYEAGEGKKSANFLALHPSGPHFFWV